MVNFANVWLHTVLFKAIVFQSFKKKQSPLKTTAREAKILYALNCIFLKKRLDAEDHATKDKTTGLVPFCCSTSLAINLVVFF